MTVLTILNHGTANSTNVNTSEGNVLVITQIARMLAGTDGVVLGRPGGPADCPHVRREHLLHTTRRLPF